jgi:uncharacterized protein YbaR (Trm112 family)
MVVCPECRHTLADSDGSLECAGCGTRFPVVEGIPVLLPSHSVFSIDQVAKVDKTFFATKVVENPLKKRVRQALPKFTSDHRAGEGGALAAVHPLLAELPRPCKGLQIGAGEDPQAIQRMTPGIEWVHSDVDLSFHPDIIADVTGLPIADESVDIVYADQVLQHVIDLQRAAQEIQRVLRVGGLVVVSMPFLFPFHGIPYDFFRVTPCGVRAIFPQTECVHIGRGSGAWSALALQMDARLVNMFGQRQARMAAAGLSRVLFSGLKYLDRLGADRRNIVSCASLVYVGRKSSRRFSAQEIMSELRQLFA